MTEGDSQTTARALETVREIIRRSGHEIRNALSGVAVNVEVVRSRSSGQSSGDIKSFAERAVLGVSEASALSDGLLALTGAVLAATASGNLQGSAPKETDRWIELLTGGDAADRLVSDIERLMGRIAVGVERSGGSVILRVSTRGDTHSKA